jgi:hypothetical protein
MSLKNDSIRYSNIKMLGLLYVWDERSTGGDG